MENQELDLKDLLYCVLQHWRKILAIAIALALVFGFYKAYRTLRPLRDSAAVAEQRAAYENSLEDFERAKGQLQDNVDEQLARLESLAEYNESSVLMRIDPMNEWVGIVRLYIEPEMQADMLPDEQNNRIKRFVSAYDGLLKSSEMLEALAAKSPETDEVRYLSEVFSVSDDPDAATIEVKLKGSTAKAVEQMPETVKQFLAERYESMCDAIGAHSYAILTEDVYKTIDSGLKTTQANNLKAITDCNDMITKAKKALTDWEGNKPTAPQSRRGAVKSAIKYAILGFIVGAAIVAFWYTAKYAMNPSFKTDDDWRNYKLPVLGRITREQQKKKFLPGLDALLDRIFGRAQRTTTEQSCALAAQSVGAALKKQGCKEATLVGRLPENQAETLARQMDAAETDISLRYAGDALTDPAAARALENTDKVLLLAERYGTRYADVEQTLTLLTAWGKTPLGVVVVE